MAKVGILGIMELHMMDHGELIMPMEKVFLLIMVQSIRDIFKMMNWSRDNISLQINFKFMKENSKIKNIKVKVGWKKLDCTHMKEVSLIT